MTKDTTMPSDEELREKIVNIWYHAYNQGMRVHNGTGDDEDEVRDVDTIMVFLREAEVRARIEQINKTICHKHGWNTSCPVLRDELATLTAEKEKKA